MAVSTDRVSYDHPKKRKRAQTIPRKTGAVYLNKQRRQRMMQQRENAKAAYSEVESLRRGRIPTSFSGGSGPLGGKQASKMNIRLMRRKAIAKTRRTMLERRQRRDEAAKQEEQDKITNKLARQRRMAERNTEKKRASQQAGMSRTKKERLQLMRHRRLQRFDL